MRNLIVTTCLACMLPFLMAAHCEQAIQQGAQQGAQAVMDCSKADVVAEFPKVAPAIMALLDQQPDGWQKVIDALTTYSTNVVVCAIAQLANGLQITPPTANAKAAPVPERVKLNSNIYLASHHYVVVENKVQRQ